MTQQATDPKVTQGSIQLGETNAGKLSPPLANMPKEQPTPPEGGGDDAVARSDGRQSHGATGAAGVVQAKVPLSPALVTAVAGSAGALLAAVTRFEGFQFTPEELATLHTLWENTGLLVTPIMQAAVGTTAMVGEKAVRYGMHRRQQQENAAGKDKASLGTEATAGSPRGPNPADGPRVPVGVEN